MISISILFKIFLEDKERLLAFFSVQNDNKSLQSLPYLKHFSIKFNTFQTTFKSYSSLYLVNTPCCSNSYSTHCID